MEILDDDGLCINIAMMYIVDYTVIIGTFIQICRLHTNVHLSILNSK